jgi:UDP-glucuronate 4-epimerase
MMSTNPILVTGAAGFIGAALTERLLGEGLEVVGIDNVNDYYDPRLKYARLARLEQSAGFRFVRLDLADRNATAAFFAGERFDRVVHLAAQAGVRYSLENPHAYLDSNLAGFLNILEGCRHGRPAHLVYASSSSVYGANEKQPFAVTDPVDHPVSLYAATKKANELMAHSYSHLYGLPVTGLRFFTVYGPWMRPDMVPFVFAEQAAKGLPIRVFNHGRMRRDFTYVDDIVDGIRRVMDHVPEPGAAGQGRAPYKLYNIGNNQPVQLLHVIDCLEQSLGISMEKVMVAMQAGDVPATYADIDDLSRDTGFRPTTSIEAGIERFAQWYRDVWQPLDVDKNRP